jgi:hypothetical protein
MSQTRRKAGRPAARAAPDNSEGEVTAE